MALTVLQLVNAALDELGVSSPVTSVTSPTDPNDKQLTAILMATGRELVQAKCWPQLKRQHTFTTSDGVHDYALPSDYFCSIFDTFWDQTNYWQMVGPVTDSTYNKLLYSVAHPTIGNTEYIRIFGRNDSDQFQITPPGGTDAFTLSFDYVSNAWIYDESGETWVTAITANDDTTAFDDDLVILGIKAKYCQAKGLDYQAWWTDYQRRMDNAVARWQGQAKGQMGGLNWAYGLNVKEGTWNL